MGEKLSPFFRNHDHSSWDGRQILGLLTMGIILDQFSNLLSNHRPLKGGLTPSDALLQHLPVDG
jgi:hypothetical protein